MPEWRTGCTVIVAVGTTKLRRADTASGMPMEWPPPSTRVALGLLTPAISSASASPASTSPPTVLRMTSSPSISGSSSISTSCGMTCSYLVVFWLSGASVWPSMVPITVRQWMAWRPRVAARMPSVSIRSCFSRSSAALSCGVSALFCSCAFFSCFNAFPPLFCRRSGKNSMPAAGPIISPFRVFFATFGRHLGGILPAAGVG